MYSFFRNSSCLSSHLLMTIISDFRPWKGKIIKKRLTGWQLESFEESYTYKIENGISLFKKNLKNE